MWTINGTRRRHQCPNTFCTTPAVKDGSQLTVYLYNCHARMLFGDKKVDPQLCACNDDACEIGTVIICYYQAALNTMNRCGLLLRSCVSITFWAPRKRLNRSRCRLGADSCGPKEPRVKDGAKMPLREWASFWKLSSPLKRNESLLQCTQQKGSFHTAKGIVQSSITAWHAMLPFVKILWPLSLLQQCKSTETKYRIFVVHRKESKFQ